MNLLITGADGFIGRRLEQKLSSEGHTVFTHEISDGDIGQPDALNLYSDIDHVYHLAAKTFVPTSWDNTFEYFKTNVLGTVTALEFCRKVRCSISLMSTYVYGEPEYLPVDEKHPVSSVSPYHETKLLDEHIAEFYNKHFKIPVTIFRPFNVYGKGQNEDFLLPTIVNQVLDPDVLCIEVKDLTPKRDYVYIDDVINCLCKVVSKADIFFGVYNIGSGFSVSVEDVIKLVMHVSGILKPYKSTGEKRITEISDSVADITRAGDELGFNPEFDLEKGLRAWLEC